MKTTTETETAEAPKKVKTIRVTLSRFNWWTADQRTLIQGFKIDKLVNAIEVAVDGQVFGISDQLTTDQARQLAAHDNVEVTVNSTK